MDALSRYGLLLIAPILAAGVLVLAGVRRLPGRPLPAGLPATDPGPVPAA